MQGELYTIGYASFSMDAFIDTLRAYNVTALVDVRSAPYSKFRPEFKKDPLHKALSACGISYIFSGNLLGARIEDPACFTGGKLNYAFLKENKNFLTGITRLLDFINGRGLMHQPPAIMCAEKDPINCHRMFLVCRTLRTYPVTIKHILADGSCEEHAVTEKRLLQSHYNLDQPDIFRSERDLLEEIYDRLCENIAI